MADAILIPGPDEPLRVAHVFHEDVYGGERLACVGGVFYVWRRTHWAEVGPDEITNGLYGFLMDKSYEAKGDLAPWKPNRTRVGEIEHALHAVAYMPQPEQPTHIAFSNGLLDLSTMSLGPHDPGVFNTCALNFAYDSLAPTPARWLRFLSELWPNDRECRECLQEVFGYWLVGGTSQHKIFMLVGPPRSGKGTIGRVATALLGQPNVCAPTMGQFAGQFGMQALVGKRLALIGDARVEDRSGSARIAVERLLSISGEDLITIQRKYRADWSGRLDVRFVLLTNEIPSFRDPSGALASRMVVLTLEKDFYGREDVELTRALIAEAPGIFNWALEGYARLQARGRFVQPESSVQALRMLADLASPVEAFVRERCEIGPHRYETTDALFSAWADFMHGNGSNSGTKDVFVRDLLARYPRLRSSRKTENNVRVRCVDGIGVGGPDS